MMHDELKIGSDPYNVKREEVPTWL